MNKKLAKFLLISGCVLIIGWLFIMDFSDLSWNTNGNSYLGLLMAMTIIANGVVHLKHKPKDE